MVCTKCSKASGALLVLLGILFLLVDLGVWSFWGVQWYTVAFLVIGLGAIGSSCCADCQSCCVPEKKKK